MAAVASFEGSFDPSEVAVPLAAVASFEGSSVVAVEAAVETLAAACQVALASFPYQDSAGSASAVGCMKTAAAAAAAVAQARQLVAGPVGQPAAAANLVAASFGQTVVPSVLAFAGSCYFLVAVASSFAVEALLAGFAPVAAVETDPAAAAAAAVEASLTFVLALDWALVSSAEEELALESFGAKERQGVNPQLPSWLQHLPVD